MASQTFPTFDPISTTFQSFKPRSVVHTDGDWHVGVQANIIRKNDKGTFDILVQERSEHVDLGTNKLDQSLAVQLIKEDNFSEDAALKRGLASELQVTDYSATKVSANLRIVKTYVEHPGSLNREIIYLYLVTIPDNTSITIDKRKIKQVFWLEWQTFLDMITTDPQKFSKTAHFYFTCKEMLDVIEPISYGILYPTKHKAQDYIPPQIVHINRSGHPIRTYTNGIKAGLLAAGEI